MPARRLSLASAAAILCAAFALWVSFGVITFTGADACASRVGILPPLGWLAALLAAALACIAVVRPHPRRVAVLWLSVLVLLPWLPMRLPLSVFVWAGPGRFWLWVVIAATLVVSGARRLSPARVGRAVTTPRQAFQCATTLAAVVFAAGAWAVSPQLPTGDEPHYLVIAQSLLNDRDLQIENNHRQGDYHAYFDGELKPHYLARGVNGQIYSVHAPGLPVLIAPAFGIFGYRGVVAMLIAVAALASGLAWLIAWRVTGHAAASWFGWATVTLSVPFFFHSFAVYPDAIGAALILAGVLPLVDERARHARALFLVGAALAMLPWLHGRLAIAAASLGLVIAARIATTPRAAVRLAAFSIGPLVSAAGWFAFFAVIYGTPNPTAPYGAERQLDLAGLGRGVAGLLFDQEFGLLPNAPVYSFALAGFAVLLGDERRRRLGVELLVVTVPYFLTVAAFPMWWAGRSAPTRFLVPLTPVLAIPSAVWFATRRTETARLLGVGGIVVSATIVGAIAATERGAPMLNNRDGASLLLLAMSPVVNLTTAMPSLFQNPPARATFDAAVWLLAIVVAFVVGRLFERRGWSGQSLATIAGAAAVGWTLVATVVVWRTNQTTIVTPTSGGLALLRQYNPDRRPIGVTYPPLRRVAAADVLPRIALADRTPAVSLTDVPAGAYEIDTAGARDARVRVALDRHLPPVDEWDADRTRSVRRLVLPVGVRTLRVSVDGPQGAAPPTVSVHARSIGGAHDRWSASLAAHATRYGPAVVFLVGGRADMEPGGTWVLGGAQADFVIVPDGASPIRLFVRNAPVANHVVLENDAWREEFDLRPREERMVTMPADTAHPGTALRVSAQSGISPAEANPRSDDRRVLGCFIETR